MLNTINYLYLFFTQKIKHEINSEQKITLAA